MGEKKKERNIRFLILSVNKGGKIALQINSQKNIKLTHVLEVRIPQTTNPELELFKSTFIWALFSIIDVFSRTLRLNYVNRGVYCIL